MPKKPTYTKEKILNQALTLVRTEGIGNLSARSIADQLGSSTAPIYSYFASMGDLEKATVKKMKDFVMQYLQNKQVNAPTPFFAFGIRYYYLSMEEEHLFRSLFIEGRFGLDINAMGRQFMPLLDTIQDLPGIQQIPNQALKELGQDLWIYTHGLVSLLFNSNSNRKESEEFFVTTLGRFGSQLIELYRRNSS